MTFFGTLIVRVIPQIGFVLYIKHKGTDFLFNIMAHYIGWTMISWNFLFVT